MIDLIDESNVVVFGTNLPKEFFEVLEDYVVPKTFINYSSYDSSLDYPADTQFIDANGDIYTVGSDGSVTVTANLADAAATSLLADVYLKYSTYDSNETYPAGTEFLDAAGNVYTIAADGTLALTGSMLSDTVGADAVFLKYSSYDSSVTYPVDTKFLDENGDIYTIAADGTISKTASLLADTVGTDDVYLRYDNYDSTASYPAGTKFLDDNGDVYTIASDGSISLTSSLPVDSGGSSVTDAPSFASGQNPVLTFIGDSGYIATGTFGPTSLSNAYGGFAVASSPTYPLDTGYPIVIPKSAVYKYTFTMPISWATTTPNPYGDAVATAGYSVPLQPYVNGAGGDYHFGANTGLDFSGQGQGMTYVAEGLIELNAGDEFALYLLIKPDNENALVPMQSTLVMTHVSDLP